MQTWQYLGILVILSVISFDGGRAYESAIQPQHNIDADGIYPQIDFMGAKNAKLQSDLKACRSQFEQAVK